MKIDPTSTGFRLTRATIHGYRAFSSVEFELGAFNVLCGVNGSGKTSALRALSFLLEDVARRIGPRITVGQRPSPFDFREDDPEQVNLFEADAQAFGESFTLGRSWVCLDQSLREGKRVAGGPLGSVSDLASRYWKSIETGDQDVIWPLLGFYPVERAVDDVPLRIRSKESYSRRSGFDRAFTAQRNFRSFFQWFREQEDAENEQRLNGAPDYRDRHLEAVRRAVCSALPGFNNLRIVRKPRLRMLITKDDESLAIQQLSDGERGVITLVGDLAKRASLLNPHLDDPLQTPGCILIDEIDLHLHPQWQRRIVQELPIIFPNLQFVVTTHSPIVCGSVKAECLLIIDDGEVKPASVYGWAVADILRKLFDISERPDEIRQQLVQLDEALDQGNLRVSEEILKSLGSNLPPDDPEIVRANVVIPFIKDQEKENTRDY